MTLSSNLKLTLSHSLESTIGQHNNYYWTATTIHGWRHPPPPGLGNMRRYHQNMEWTKETNLNELTLRMSPASRTPVVPTPAQSQRLCQYVSCQHVKLAVRLNSICANSSRDLAVTVAIMDSSLPDIAYSPHICANALSSSTGELSMRSNSSDMINVLTMSNTNSPGNSDLLFWQLKNGGSVIKWMAELRVRGKSQQWKRVRGARDIWDAH